MPKKTKPPRLVPQNMQKVLRRCVCPQCGETLIFGRWRHYFEYVGLTLDEFSRHDHGKDKSDSWHLQCPRDNEHSVAGILTDADNEMIYDFITAH